MGALIAAAIVMAIIWTVAKAVYASAKRRRLIEQTTAALAEVAGPTDTMSPEEQATSALLGKVKQDGSALHFGQLGDCEVFSDGRFLEIAEELPPAVQKIKDLFSPSLSDKDLKSSIPQDAEKKGTEVTKTQSEGDKVLLLTASNRIAVNKVYFEYLRLRYPEAKVFCVGEDQPIVFIDAGRPRGVAMPIKQQ